MADGLFFAVAKYESSENALLPSRSITVYLKAKYRHKRSQMGSIGLV